MPLSMTVLQLSDSQLLTPQITDIRQSAYTALGIAGLDISVARVGREERDVVAFAAADESKLRRVPLLVHRLSGFGHRHADRRDFTLEHMAELSLADTVAEEELHKSRASVTNNKMNQTAERTHDAFGQDVIFRVKLTEELDHHRFQLRNELEARRLNRDGRVENGSGRVHRTDDGRNRGVRRSRRGVTDVATADHRRSLHDRTEVARLQDRIDPVLKLDVDLEREVVEVCESRTRHSQRELTTILSDAELTRLATLLRLVLEHALSSNSDTLITEAFDSAVGVARLARQEAHDEVGRASGAGDELGTQALDVGRNVGAVRPVVDLGLTVRDLDSETGAGGDEAGDASLSVGDGEELARVKDNDEPAVDCRRLVELLTLDVPDAIARTNAAALVLDSRRRKLACFDLHGARGDRDLPLSERRLSRLDALEPLVEHVDAAAGLDRGQTDRVRRLRLVELFSPFLSGLSIAEFEGPPSDLGNGDAGQFGPAQRDVVVPLKIGFDRHVLAVDLEGTARVVRRNRFDGADLARGLDPFAARHDELNFEALQKTVQPDELGSGYVGGADVLHGEIPARTAKEIEHDVGEAARLHHGLRSNVEIQVHLAGTHSQAAAEML